MVDFRYHLVSIIAIFLALAVGIVVGTTALNGPVLDDLQGRVTGLTREKRILEVDLRAAQQRSTDQERAVSLLSPGVVGGRLADSRVVLVSAPDAPAGLAEDLVPLLRSADATVSLQVRLRPALFDPVNTALLTDLVARVALPGVEAPSGPPVDQALSQLSQVLVHRTGAPAPAAATAQRVLAAYSAEDLIDVEGAAGAGGSLAVVLAAEPVREPAQPVDAKLATEQARALVGLGRTLDARSTGAVLAGSSAVATAAAAEDSAVQVLRSDAGAADRVSTVDGADTAAGRLAVVLALAEQRAGRSGAYGSGPGADAALPDLASP